MTTVVAELAVDPRRAEVYEHGWQSWSPTTTYRIGDRPYRARDPARSVMGYRPDAEAPAAGFQGEGLLAVRPVPDGPIHLVAARDAREHVPSIRAAIHDSRLVVTAGAGVDHDVDDGAGGFDGALARWADRFAARMAARPPRPAPTIWCSWYQYFTRVTEADIVENLDAIGRLQLPVDVVQIDDGYQVEIGDWLTGSDRFASLPALVERIRASGRRAGIWVAPFLVGARSRLAGEHPDWLVRVDGGFADAGRNWDQQLYVLDATVPDAAAHLAEVFATMRGWGIDFFKVDFLYAGAIPGRRHGDASPVAAYRDALGLIRRSIGDAYLLGCGAPILPSVGLVDAMRVSPDTAPHHEPAGGDLARPGSRSAMMTGAARAFQHGRFWVNDPDCLIVRPEVERREAWATHIERFGGLRGSSDRLSELDAWGLERTRELLGTPPRARFV